MGVDFTAKAFIGCELPKDKLYRTVRVRLDCGHSPPADAEFCPKCGKATYRVGKEPIPEWDGDDKLAGLKVVSGTDGDRLFACVHAVSGRDGRNDGCQRLDASDWDINAIRDYLRSALHPLGLWNESTFGLWSVLYCSY